MMFRFTGRFFNVLSALFVFCALAHSAEAAKPLRALLITGGCCHDYEAQKTILTNGISARANVTWTVLHENGDGKAHELSLYKKANWAKDFDVIVHNECFGQVKNVQFVESIVAAHTNGIPAVMIHCSMHSYREAQTDEWRKLLGVTSMRHQHHVAFEVKTLNKEHPVMKGFPETWMTP